VSMAGATQDPQLGSSALALAKGGCRGALREQKNQQYPR